MLWWVKSSLSFSNGNCVEVAELPDGGVAVRNSRDPGGMVLQFTAAEWQAFIVGARLGEFDIFGTSNDQAASVGTSAGDAIELEGGCPAIRGTPGHPQRRGGEQGEPFRLAAFPAPSRSG